MPTYHYAVPRDRQLTRSIETSTQGYYQELIHPTPYPPTLLTTFSGPRVVDRGRMADQTRRGWQTLLGKVYEISPMSRVNVLYGRTVSDGDFYENVVNNDTGVLIKKTRYYTEGPALWNHPAFMAQLDLNGIFTGSEGPWTWFKSQFPMDNALRNYCITRLWAEAGQVDVLALVSAAEMNKSRQSVDNLLDAFGRLSRAYEKYRKRARAKNRPPRSLREVAVNVGVPLTGDLAQVWMEYRYGVMPLIYDIQAWSDVLNGHKKAARVTFQANDAVKSSHLPSTSSGTYEIRKTWGTQSYQWRYSAGALVSPEIDIGLTRIASSAWELTKLSWMVDWAIQVGDHVAAAETLARRVVKAAWITDRASCTITKHFRQEAGSPLVEGSRRTSITGVYPSFSDHQQWSLQERAQVLAPPTLPSTTLRLNWRRGADLAAFLRGMLSKWG